MRVIGHLGLFVTYGLVGALVVLIGLGVVYLEGRDDLSPWHRVDLDDYREGQEESLAGYLALEGQLFEQLSDELVDRLPAATNPDVNRYARGSLSSSEKWPRNWNRTYELDVAEPRGLILMLHGMSDSPYSLRSLAENLNARGFRVLGLRYPGHGTAPSSLTRTRWEDMSGAATLAARYLAESAPGKPLFVFGYSTGAPLAIELSLNAKEADGPPMPAGLVFFSPALGITPIAAAAPWQARLGRLLGLEKLAWNTIEPEYDPFKYRSFPVNAAIQVWRVSQHVAERLQSLPERDGLGKLPPILSFQSVADDTIQARALLDVLYGRIPARDETADRRHALVVYDLNRNVAIEPLLRADPSPLLNQLLADAGRRFEFTVVSNAGANGGAVLSRTGSRGAVPEVVCRLDAGWPRGVYSLTHIALPFPPTDPLYGGPEALPYPGINLGNVVLRGESSALKVSPAGLLRQSYNPFYDYQLERIARFIGVEAPPACHAVLPD